jgi:hypothetical protein
MPFPLLLKLPELRDSHLPIGKDGSDLQLPSKRFYIPGQRAEVYVSTVLDFGHFALIRFQHIGKLGLRHLARFADLL